MTTKLKIDRRSVLKGIAGATLVLPVLDAMGKEVAEQTPRRFCAIYTANGMSLPKTDHKIDDWSWFPRANKDGKFSDRAAREALRPRAARRGRGASDRLLRGVGRRRRSARVLALRKRHATELWGAKRPARLLPRI